MPKQSFRIALIGSYVPRRCGIATFGHDLATAISGTEAPDMTNGAPTVEIVAINDLEEGYAYGPEVTTQIHQHLREDYRNAADILNTSRCDAVLLQHEYGLFGGECGEHLLDLIDHLQKPLITTLHSVLSEPSAKQKSVLERIGARSRFMVVMANRARLLLNEVYGVPLDRARLIPHGVPDVPFGDTEPFKERFGLSGRPMILTFGLLGPGKGIEIVLDALAKVVPDHPHLAYVILGVTHPAVKRDSGELYRISLERRAVELGIQKNVLFHNRYVSSEDLREYLQAADVYVTPYRAKEQITSGTLAYALACGKAIISTPYWHAQELLVNGRGRLVEFGDTDGFSAALAELIGDDDKRQEVRKAAYDFGRSMIWSEVGKQYLQICQQARHELSERRRDVVAERKVLMRLSLPEVRLDHLFAMSDDTGMLQHAQFATPDRRYGYCTDDNARALIVAAMAWTIFQEPSVLPYLRTYLSFLHFAQVPETGRFRNFMSYDRRWLEDEGSEDCQGRALWALGYLVSHAPNESAQCLAADLFRSSTGALDSLEHVRSWAFAILGLHYYLREFPDDGAVRRRAAELADRLDNIFTENEADDWPWFESLVSYDNGRVPQALIIAGHVLARPELQERGQRVLQWLCDVQTAPEGHLSVIGNKGWLQRGQEPAQFDQQPIEPAALIGACKAAYRVSGDGRWLAEMRRCFEWYIGRNDQGLTMIDFKSRGCYDGLEAGSVNQNQGAESTLSWLLSLLTMHEMQTGEAPEVG